MITRTTDLRLRLILLVGAFVAIPVPMAGQGMATPLVVIDAGHGGVDPGARGPRGTREKDIALRLALDLAAILRAQPGLEVRLTRETDDLVPLHERARLANVWREAGGQDRPALFLSIHANAHDRASVRGFETYFLSEALTEDARRVAALENSAQRFEAAAPADPLGFILHDLRQNLYLRESSDAAILFQRRLAAVHPGPDRGVKQAGFVVLSGAFMPALLVELGFVSNERDEALLASRDYSRRAAEELADAVGAFFRGRSTREITALP